MTLAWSGVGADSELEWGEESGDGDYRQFLRNVAENGGGEHENNAWGKGYRIE